MNIEVLIGLGNMILVGIGVIIASQGLNTWKKQLHGKDKYTVSKSLLKYTYKFRDNIKHIRHPFVSVTEYGEVPLNNIYSDRYYQMRGAYLDRVKKLEETRDIINDNLLDAEAIWGEEILNLYKELFELQRKLFSNLEWYLESLVDKSYEKIYKDEIINGMGNEEDSFFQELEIGIIKIEKFLKPNMK